MRYGNDLSNVSGGEDCALLVCLRIGGGDALTVVAPQRSIPKKPAVMPLGELMCRLRG